MCSLHFLFHFLEIIPAGTGRLNNCTVQSLETASSSQSPCPQAAHQQHEKGLTGELCTIPFHRPPLQQISTTNYSTIVYIVAGILLKLAAGDAKSSLN